MSNPVVFSNLQLELPQKINNVPTSNFALEPGELHLEEGISKIGKAELTVYSPKKDAKSYNTLSGLLEQNAGCIVKQKFNDSVVSRYFSGIVTEFEHCGLVSDGVYCCKLVIQPPLIHLTHSISHIRYTGISLKEVIIILCKSCGYAENDIEFLPSDNLPSLLTAPRNFYQKDETDYDFFCRLITEAGLSFLDYTKKPAANGQTSRSCLCIYSNAAKFKGTSGIYTEKLEEATRYPSKFNALQNTQDSHFLWDFSKKKQIGEDKIHVTEQNGIQTLSVSTSDKDEKRTVYRNLFSDLNETDLKSATNNYLSVLKSTRNCFNARTHAFTAMPGKQIKISLWEKRSLNFRVFQTSMDVSSPVSIPELDKTSGSVEIAFSAISEIDQVLFPTELYDTSQNVLNALTQGKPPTYLKAVVCTVDGKTTPKNSLSTLSDNYTFYAMALENAGTYQKNDKIKVQFTMSGGGRKQGLFHVPRLGDRILVSICNDTALLIGFLPDKEEMKELETMKALPGKYNDSITDGSDNYNLNQMTTLRHLSARMENNVQDYLPLVFNHQKASTDTTGDFIPKMNHAISELGFYTGVKVANATDGKMEKCDAAVLTSAGNMNLYAVKNNAWFHGENIHVFTVGSSTRRANTDSAKLTDWVPEQEILLNNAKKIIVEAKDKITLRAGRSILVIDRHGITLAARKFSDITGPLAATLSLHGVRGAYMTSIDTRFYGMTGVRLAEGGGACIEVGSGSTSIGGTAIRFATSGPGGVIISLGISVYFALLQYISVGTHHGNYVGKIGASDRGAYSTMGRLAAEALQMVECMKYYSNDSQYTNRTVAMEAIKVLRDIVMALYGLTESLFGEWFFKENSKGTMTHGQEFGLACHAAIMLAWGIIDIMQMLLTKPIKTATIKMDGGRVEIEAEHYDVLTRVKAQNNSAMSGVDIDDIDLPEVVE
mgnify:CR=1 FL=1